MAGRQDDRAAPARQNALPWKGVPVTVRLADLAEITDRDQLVNLIRACPAEVIADLIMKMRGAEERLARLESLHGPW
jgi:hypothetical protein